jgi:hypothetical protein
MRQLITTAALVLLAVAGAWAQVSQAEYFFDTDPGVGNGTPLSITQGDAISEIAALPIGALTPGNHWVHVRVRATNGRWSHYESRMFNVEDPTAQPVIDRGQPVVAEYFFDTDPGVGNGTPLSITPGTSIDETSALPIGALAPGNHWVHVRIKGADGLWSHYESRMFNVEDPTAQPVIDRPELVSGEYFFNTDPGIGNGTAFSIAAADSVTMPLAITEPGLPLGTHWLFLRIRNTDGTWSHYEGREFEVSEIVLSTVSGTITYDNNASTPMSNVTVELLDAQNAVVATATTDASGSYSFSDVADGSYTVRPSTTKAWGGVSSIDITLYRRHIGNVPGFILQGIRLGSGDVNVSNTLTSIDLTIIKRRIGAQISSFASGDWLFEDGSITVSGGNVSRNIKAICYGDANGSYTPPQ